MRRFVLSFLRLNSKATFSALINNKDFYKPRLLTGPIYSVFGYRKNQFLTMQERHTSQLAPQLPAHSKALFDKLVLDLKNFSEQKIELLNPKDFPHVYSPFRALYADKMIKEQARYTESDFINLKNFQNALKEFKSTKEIIAWILKIQGSVLYEDLAPFILTIVIPPSHINNVFQKVKNTLSTEEPCDDTKLTSTILSIWEKNGDNFYQNLLTPPQSQTQDGNTSIPLSYGGGDN